jgi:hypothetical protein
MGGLVQKTIRQKSKLFEKIRHFSEAGIFISALLEDKANKKRAKNSCDFAYSNSKIYRVFSCFGPYPLGGIGLGYEINGKI